MLPWAPQLDKLHLKPYPLSPPEPNTIVLLFFKDNVIWFSACSWGWNDQWNPWAGVLFHTLGHDCTYLFSTQWRPSQPGLFFILFHGVLSLHRAQLEVVTSPPHPRPTPVRQHGSRPLGRPPHSLTLILWNPPHTHILRLIPLSKNANKAIFTKNLNSNSLERELSDIQLKRKVCSCSVHCAL